MIFLKKLMILYITNGINKRMKELYPGATSAGGYVSYMYTYAMSVDDLVRNNRATELQKWVRRINCATRITAYANSLRRM